MKSRLDSVIIVFLGIMCMVFLMNIVPAYGGCGCEKLIPPPAQLIPRVGYPGGFVRIYDDALVEGKEYSVEFEKVPGKPRVVCKRNRDGLLMLKVKIPESPLQVGPTAIKVKKGRKNILKIPKEHFTMAAKPIPVLSEAGTYLVYNYKAPVDYSGTVYVALDMSEVTNAVTIVGTFLDYPLWLEPEDVIILNSQGFTMTELDSYKLPIPMPGIDVVYEWNDTNRSDSIIYWRHEFGTYFAEHEERECYFIDPEDSDYHMDGTRHIDHSQLIFAISGEMSDGNLPSAGRTGDIQISLGVFYGDLEALDFVDNPPEAYGLTLDFNGYKDPTPGPGSTGTWEPW